MDDGSSLFSVLDKKQRIYVQQPGQARQIAMPTGSGTLARSLALQEKTRERPTIPARVPGEGVEAGLKNTVSMASGLTVGELHYRLIERLSPPSILVNSAYDIVHLSESAGRFLQFTGGEPTRNLLNTVHPNLRVEVRAALYAAVQTHGATTAFRVLFDDRDVRRFVDIRITPADDIAPGFLLVVFEEHAWDGEAAMFPPRSAEADETSLHLERELLATKAHLRYTIEESEASTEELKASNEELQAINEELRSATEELETSREESQSINEELTMLNDELKSNVDQLARSNNDLQNLMTATDIATVFLDRKLCIQRFTPSAKSLFSFISADLGRPLADLSRHVDYPEIISDAERSLAQLLPTQREVNAGERYYIARIVPYRTVDDHIAGVVLTFLEITEQKRAEREITRLAADSERQRRVYETVLSNTPDFMYVFSLDHRVLYANDALIEMWGRGYEGAIGKTFLEIGYEPWHAEMHDREIDQVRATRQPIRGEVPFNGAHGVREYDYIFVPVIGADGEVEAVAGTTRDVTERKAKVDQLRRNHDTFSALIQNNPFGVYVVDADFRLAQVSLGAQKVFETVDPLLGRDFNEVLQTLWPEPFASESIARFRHTFNTGEAYSSPSMIERRADSGVVEQYDRRIERISMPDGRYGVVCYFYDLSDRQHWEASLLDSEERLRMALTAARMVAWEWTAAEGKVRVSDNAADLFGLQSNKALLSIEQGLSLVHPDDVAAYRDIFQKAIDERGRYQTRYRLIRPIDGRMIWIEERGKAVLDQPNGGARLFGVAADITERHRTEVALRESEDRSAFVLRSCGVGFWYCDLPFDILEWDDLVKAHFYLPPDAVVTIQTFYDRLHPDDRERTRDAVECSIAERTPYNVDYRTVNPDNGDVTWVRAIGRTFYADDGTPSRFDGVTLDVSNQKQVEASLKESEQRFREMADTAAAANESKSMFLANMSHEIRTPMTAILGYAELLMDLIHQEDAVRHLQTIRNNGNYLLDIINDILDLSKIEAGNVDVACERFEPHRLIEDIRSIMDIRAQERCLELEVLYDGTLPRVIHSDAKRLKQILINLIGNAIKFTHQGKVQICVRFDAETRHFQFDVIDTGIGISTEQRERLFKPFAQGDSTVSRNFGGTGLGLVISQRLAEMLGGSITVSSTEGHGSKFSVSIATGDNAGIELVHYDSMVVETETQSASRLSEPIELSCHVLIVDDRRDIRFLSKYILTKCGATVDECEDGLIAVEHVSACLRNGSVPDLVLLDMQMPNLDGYSTAQKLRSLGYVGPIIALTADAMQSDMNKCLEAGCNA